MSSGEDFSLARFWAPRYWPTWLLWAGLRLVALLPFRWQTRTGAVLGRVLGRFKRRERSIARRNLELCFPDLSDRERNDLLDRHFRSVGLSLVEMAIGWYAPAARIRRLVELRGVEHIHAALREGRGVLLVSAHFTPLEICVAALEDFGPPIACMYRPQRNAMMDILIRRGRRRFAADQIARDDVRRLIRRLRSRYVVLYMPDQTYLGSQTALLPFFGEPALTNIATGKLARISGARVVPYFFRRKADDTGYVVEIGPPLDAFPSADAAADTRRLVALLEDFIRSAPDQYLWLYKKFKRRPAPLPDAYAGPAS